MKTLQLFAIFIFSLFQLQAQSLEGIWEGWFFESPSSPDTTHIKLSFKPHPSQRFDVQSFSFNSKFKISCRVKMIQINDKRIHLTETSIIQSTIKGEDGVLQNFVLDINENFTVLTGLWYYNKNQLPHIKGRKGRPIKFKKIGPR